MLNFYLRNYEDIILVKHVLEFFVNGSFQKEHINFGSLTIRDEFVHFLDSVADHDFKGSFFLSVSHQVSCLNITINQNQSLVFILILYLFV